MEFDPAYKVDRVCGTVKQKLTIVYQDLCIEGLRSECYTGVTQCLGTLSKKNKPFKDHPQRDHVNLVGEVIFPNLTLSSTAALATSNIMTVRRH